MADISQNFSEELAKKILGKKDNAILFLEKFASQNKELETKLKWREVKSGKRKGEIVLDIPKENVWKTIVENWNYSSCKNIIRELFTETEKYKSGKNSNEVMETLVKEWEKLNLGEVKWPFSQGAFDGFVQRVNSESEIGVVKDEKVKRAAVQYRRLKELNTLRNDFIETLIFEQNESILPTLSHRRSVDFFVNAISFDQKVAKSPTKQFQKDFKENWKKEAIEKPEKVAEYLYEFQDEGRFGADSRLLIVYLDEDISVQRIKEIIEETNLEKPLEVSFTFKHKNNDKQTYKVKCFVILLYNEG